MQTALRMASSDTNEFSFWCYLWCWWQSFSVTSSNQKDFAKSANFYISACEMQEIPIIGTSFLEEDARSYPGTVFKITIKEFLKNPIILIMHIFSSAMPTRM